MFSTCFLPVFYKDVPDGFIQKFDDVLIPMLEDGTLFAFHFDSRKSMIF